MTLKQYLSDPSQPSGYKKNSISRCSEILGVHRNWIHKWFRGEWEPSIEFHRKAQGIVASGMKFDRKKSRGGLPAELFAKADQAKRLRAMAESANALAAELES